jgi:hypothetical protein
MQRNIFVVPRKPVGGMDIAAAEAAAAADPAAKKELIKLLHVSCGCLPARLQQGSCAIVSILHAFACAS